MTGTEDYIALLEHPEQIVSATRPLSLFEFLQVFWPEVSDDEFIPNWHIEHLCEALEGIAARVGDNLPKEKDLIINVPPGTTKTMVCSVMFPAWCWTRWYWMRFITASYSAALALESAEKSRDLIKSERFRRMYPDLGIKDDKDMKSNFRCVKREYTRPGYPPQIKHGGNRYSTSVGGTLTGFHGHILIVDDPLNPDQAASEKELENANRWMEQTLPTRKTDKAVTATILIMQRLHENDPTGRILANKKKIHKIRHICLPGQIRDYADFVKPPELKREYIDDLLDVRRLDWDILAELEADLGQYGFAGQIGQNPAPPGGGMFKVDHLLTIDSVNPIDVGQTVRYWDKAATETLGAAYTAGVKMSKLKTGKFLIQDIVRGRWATETREKMIRATAEADGRDVRIYLEQEPGSGGKESVEASIKNLVGFAAYADKPTGDKITRADPFSVQVNIGQVMLLRADWNRGLKDEMEVFPFGTYKDQVDAASGAFNLLTKKKEVRIIR